MSVKSPTGRSFGFKILGSALVLVFLGTIWSAAPAQTENILPPVEDLIPGQPERLGKWEPTNSPTCDSEYTFQRLLPSGKVFRYSRSDAPGSEEPEEPCSSPGNSQSERSKPEIYDPKGKANGLTGVWVKGADPQVATTIRQDGGQQTAQIQSATVLSGTAGCGQNCGKVLVHFKVCLPSDGKVWKLYDPASDFWQDASSSVESPLERSGSSSVLLTSNCGDRCGDVLVVGAGFSCHTGERADTQSEFYDPAIPAWSEGPGNLNAYTQSGAPLLAALPDGRVLAMSCLETDDASVPVSEVFDDGVWKGDSGEPLYCHRGPEALGIVPVTFRAGQVLVMGYDSRAEGLRAQLFDPRASAEESWTDVEKACCGKAVVLPNGKALIVKQDGSSALWDPEHKDALLPAALPEVIRSPERATLLAGPECGSNCGKVLLTGKDIDGNLRAELYTPAPELTSLGPTEGPLTGGSRVEINGFSFVDRDSIEVDFGGIPANDLEFVSESKLRVTVPEGSAPGPIHVHVKTPGGTTAETELSRFTYLPAISGLTPDRGRMQGGTEVAISGKGLSKTESVRFGNAEAQTFRVVSDTQVVATNAGHGKPEVVPVSLVAGGLNSVPAFGGANLFTFLSDDPLRLPDEDPDDPLPSVPTGAASSTAVSRPLSPVLPGGGPGPVSSAGPASGPPGPGSPPPTGPLGSAVTNLAPNAGVPAIGHNLPHAGPAGVLGSAQTTPPTPAMVTVGDQVESEVLQPGIRHAMIGLSDSSTAFVFMGAAVVAALGCFGTLALARSAGPYRKRSDQLSGKPSPQTAY